LQIDVKKLQINRAATRGEDSIDQSHLGVESHDTRDTNKIKGVKIPSNG